MLNTANKTKGLTEWNAINWREANRNVRNLRQRIFRATQAGETKKVRSLQKLLLRSLSNVVVSVRRVTQENAGKLTAGVDRVVVKTPEARTRLVAELVTYEPWKAKPVKRVYIPKANGKLRPLGIPTIKDRAIQAMVKNALEPQWEAQFESSSYGFRPGRGCHDALERVWSILSKGKKLWIIDADIEGAFDNIQHQHLLKAIDTFPAKGLIKQWLKAGYVENGVKYDTESGTPQGGVISPLLANIALHGLSDLIGEIHHRGGTYADGQVTMKHKGPRSLVRYADDFVICCESKLDAEQTQELVENWLNERGLKLSSEKTRIVHASEGFDFLGCNIRRYADSSTRSGHKILTKPSKSALEKIKARLRSEWLSFHGRSVEVVLKKLNPIIRGWARYYQPFVSAETFKSLDTFMFHREMRYIKRTHPNKGIKDAASRYFGRLKKGRKDNWVFGNKETGEYLMKFQWFPIERYVMVRGFSSPDDATLNKYWNDRRMKRLWLKKEIWSIVTKVQADGRCPVCRESLWNGEELHIHHMIRDPKTPDRENVSNKRVLHLYCHRQVHAPGVESPNSAKRMLK